MVQKTLLPPVLLAAFFSVALGEDPAILRDNDRVVLLGNTFVERAQRYGHLETAMLLASPAKDLQFRNLGWSGDSVFNDSRSYFGPPAEGRTRLGRALGELKPDVVFVCYGTGAALSVHQGWTGEKSVRSGNGLEADLEVFQQGYRALIETIRTSSEKGPRRIVLVTPPPLENLGPPLPDQVENNRNLAAFCGAIRTIAAESALPVIDLFESIGVSQDVASPALTDNGVHYGDAGYRVIANHWIEGMGLPSLLSPDAREESVARLRTAVVEKNRLFFHRWRPANETYLFLFRKHEQGQNAREIPMFDPLIAEKEAEIAKLREEARNVLKP